MNELRKEENVRWTYKNVVHYFCFKFYRNNVQTNVQAGFHVCDDSTKDEKLYMDDV